MIQDFLVEDKWIDKNGEEQTALRKVGVSFTLKGGGMRHKIYSNVAISGECLSLPQKKKARNEEVEEPESGETGDGHGE
jgi:hypothetical protein